VPRPTLAHHQSTPMIHTPLSVNSISGVHTVFTETSGNS
jgi:hypothetical protein